MSPPACATGGEHVVALDQPGVLLDTLPKRLIRFPANPRTFQRRKQIFGVAPGRRLGDQVAQARPVAESLALVDGKAHSQFRFQRGDGIGQVQCIEQAGPLARGDRDDHECLAVAGHEITSERAVKRIAIALSVAAKACFGHLAKMGQ